VSTQSYSAIVQSVHPLVDYHGLRLVVQSAMWGRWVDRPGILSVYFEGVPVTQYSPTVFDAFVNQTKVGPFSSNIPHPDTELRMHP